VTTQPGSPQPDGGLGAALVQLAAHAERLSGLDRALADLGTAVGQVRAGLAEHAAALEALGRLEQAVRQLADQLTPPAARPPGPAYQPIPVIRWWSLDGPEREEAVERLRGWVQAVYRPLYGHLAGPLGSCWDQHPLALVTLDWLCELWGVLYLTGERAVTAHAEFGTRILPAAADLLTTETRNCTGHRTAGPATHAWAGTR
jgi:hypothetical protein